MNEEIISIKISKVDTDDMEGITEIQKRIWTNAAQKKLSILAEWFAPKVVRLYFSEDLYSAMVMIINPAMRKNDTKAVEVVGPINLFEEYMYGSPEKPHTKQTS